MSWLSGIDPIVSAPPSASELRCRLDDFNETLRQSGIQLPRMALGKRLRTEAKKELSVRGTVQYRLDEESMLRLMQVADAKKVPLGTLARMWLIERLNQEDSRQRGGKR